MARDRELDGRRLAPTVQGRGGPEILDMRRILAIDGGGINGVFPLAFLASIEETLGCPIGRFFDFIAGTSTGGIIALGLGLGFSAQELMMVYQHFGAKVFAGPRVVRLLRWLGSSKYSQTPLKELLTHAFGDRKLGESSCRLLIPAVNLETGKAHIYKTAHHARFEKDYRETAVTVALATAAAPSYFPAFRDPAGTLFVDGGLWANNPVGLAVIEAIRVLEWPSTNLRILSLGCTETPTNPGIAGSVGMGCVYWAWRGPELFMSTQSSASLGTAILLAGEDNVVRVSPIVARGRFSLDNVRRVDSLSGLGRTEARTRLSTLRPIFFSEPAEDFTPYHRP
jgi:patatin-like phospholipase/acyl hydrolase